MGKGDEHPARRGADADLLAVLLRWAPVVVAVTGIMGVVVGVAAVGHERGEIKLMGASMALGAVLFGVVAVTLLLLARAVVAQWQDDGGRIPPPAGSPPPVPDERSAPPR